MPNFTGQIPKHCWRMYVVYCICVLQTVKIHSRYKSLSLYLSIYRSIYLSILQELTTIFHNVTLIQCVFSDFHFFSFYTFSTYLLAFIIYQIMYLSHSIWITMECQVHASEILILWVNFCLLLLPVILK